MAELGDAADSKSAVLQGAWGFESPSRHKGDTPLSPLGFWDNVKNLRGDLRTPRVVIPHTNVIQTDALPLKGLFVGPTLYLYIKDGIPPSLHSVFVKASKTFMETSEPPRVVIPHTGVIQTDALPLKGLFISLSLFN